MVHNDDYCDSDELEAVLRELGGASAPPPPPHMADEEQPAQSSPMLPQGEVAAEHAFPRFNVGEVVQYVGAKGNTCRAVVLEIDHANQQYLVGMPMVPSGRWTLEGRLHPMPPTSPLASQDDCAANQNHSSADVVNADTTCSNSPTGADPMDNNAGGCQPSHMPKYTQISGAQLDVDEGVVQRLTLPHTDPSSTSEMRKLNDEVVNIGADLVMRANINRCFSKQHAKLYIFSTHWFPKLMSW
jgi:hypothetical protein